MFVSLIITLLLPGFLILVCYADTHDMRISSCTGVGLKINCEVVHTYEGSLDSVARSVGYTDFSYAGVALSAPTALTFSMVLDSYLVAQSGGDVMYSEVRDVYSEYYDCGTPETTVKFDSCGALIVDPALIFGVSPGALPDYNSYSDYCGNNVTTYPYICVNYEGNHFYGVAPRYSTVSGGTDRKMYVTDQAHGSEGMFTVSAAGITQVVNFDSQTRTLVASTNSSGYVYLSSPFKDNFPVWFQSTRDGVTVPKPDSGFDFSLARYYIGDWVTTLLGGFSFFAPENIKFVQYDTVAAMAARHYDFCSRIIYYCLEDTGIPQLISSPVIVDSSLISITGFDWTGNGGVVSMLPKQDTVQARLISGQLEHIKITTHRRVWLDVLPPVATLLWFRSLDNVSYIGIDNTGNAGDQSFTLTTTENVTYDVSLALIRGVQTLVRPELYTSVCMDGTCFRDIRPNIMYQTIVYKNVTFVTNTAGLPDNYYTNNYYVNDNSTANITRVVIVDNEFTVNNYSINDGPIKDWLLRQLMYHELAVLFVIVVFVAMVKIKDRFTKVPTREVFNNCGFLSLVISVVSLITVVLSLL